MKTMVRWMFVVIEAGLVVVMLYCMVLGWSWLLHPSTVPILDREWVWTWDGVGKLFGMVAWFNLLPVLGWFFFPDLKALWRKTWQNEERSN